MRLASGIAAALAVLCASRAALAADINADPTTYKALLGTLKPGDTLHLAAGHYPRIAVTNLNGLSDAWITITGPAVYPRTAIVDADSGPCCNTVEITNTIRSVSTRARDWWASTDSASTEPSGTFVAASRMWRLKTVKMTSDRSIAPAADMNAGLQP